VADRPLFKAMTVHCVVRDTKRGLEKTKIANDVYESYPKHS